MKNEFEVAFNEISELRSLSTDVVLEALQTALVSAYRRDSNASAAQRVEAEIDPGTGRARIFVEKEVVDEVLNHNTEVDLEKARYYHPEAELGETVMVQVEGTTKKFGRIAAQTAKQVILQKIREAERNSLYEEFIEKEGDIINGTVQSTNAAMVTISLGRAEAIMPRAQQIPGERYRPHDKVRVYVLEVKRGNRGPQIITSRSHRNMLRRLLEFEVPEIYNGQIEIKNIAREAGYRSKVAVAALQEGIDPVGACVGMRGIRIQNIVKELHDEKIDVIEWNPKQEDFIKKALSPARVTGVYLDDDPDNGRTAVVIVPDDQLSLAIGREGQNARLAAKLTGWRIDIKSVTEAVTHALDNLHTSTLMTLTTSHTDMLTEVGLIMEKKEAGRAIMPEDYRLLDQFADIVERKLQKTRDDARAARLAEINAVKMTLPQHAFDILVTQLDLPDSMIESLQPLENAGEIMLRFLIDEGRLRRMLGVGNEGSLIQLQAALDKVVMPDDDLMVDELDAVEDDDEFDYEAIIAAAKAAESEGIAEVEPEAAVTEVVAEPEVIEDVDEFIEDELEVPEVLTRTRRKPTKKPEPEVEPIIAFPEDLEAQEEALREKKRKAAKAKPREEVEPILEEEGDIEELDEAGNPTKKGSKDRQKRRQLVFDEKTGETYARRRRKGSRKRDEWSDF